MPDAANKSHLSGTLVAKNFEFNGVVYNDYLISGTSVGKNASVNPPAIAQIGTSVFYMPQYQKDDQGWFELHTLHDFKAGSVPTFHIHWTHDNASPTGNVVWMVDYTAIRGYNQGVFDVDSPTTVSTTVDASGVPQYGHDITPDDDMSFLASDDLEPDSIVMCRIYRGGTGDGDTFNDDPFLLEIDVHYERGQVGTLERNRPYPDEGFD